MRRSVSFVATFALLIVGSEGVSALGAGQDARPASSAEGAPGRPTLKLRQPGPDSPSPNTSDENRSSAIIVSQDSATVNQAKAQNLVKVKFSGLTAFDESDVLNAFREQQVLPGNQMPELQSLKKPAAVLEGMLQTQGYPHASV